MTLNITVLTETRIFQSSDFRLSTRDGPLIVPAMKMIVVEYPRFSGFICYTGFAKRDAGETKDTGDYIEEWLEGTADMRMDQVAEHLRAAATAYIADRLGSDLLPMRLTITLTAFIAHVPRAVIVSNFENTDGKVTNSILSEFQLSWVPFRKETGPVVLITGKKGAVGEHERTYLLDIVLGSREDSGRIRQEMEALNRRAASTAEAEGGVSEE